MKIKFFSIFLAVVIFITAIFIAYKINYPTKYKTFVEKYSLQYDIEKSLVFAIIRVESSFNNNAKSSVGALGLMQIMPATAEFIAKELNIVNYDMFNAEQNIKFGCFYLNYLFSKFNNLQLVLYAYNCGEGRVNRFLKGEKLPKETLNYYKKVIGVKRVYNLVD